MAKPAVIVVGADKGGVGKTTVCRTVLDYFSANNVPTRAFDTESPRGTLKRFHPDITEIVDMTATADQMKIFDTLGSAAPSVTVIDVRAGLLSPALASLRDIGFLDAAKSGQITFAVFHILGPSIASLDEIAETASFMDGAKYFLVKNFINNTSFFEWDQATYNSYFHRIKDATEITIPKLNEMAFEQVEVSSVPFLKFVANKGRATSRELLLRAARLRAPLARQRLGRVRPHQANARSRPRKRPRRGPAGAIAAVARREMRRRRSTSSARPARRSARR